LNELDITVGVIHEDTNQIARQRIIAEFRRGQLLNLVTTVLPCINVPEISCVINVSLPRVQGNKDKPVDSLTYLRKMRYCVRWNRKGVVVNLISPSELSELYDVQKIVGQKFTEVTLEEIPRLEERAFHPFFRSLEYI